uniref:Uncharacterized protein n=1 Tax=Corethron hystrix TaxID=216773 RepID=A0A7S1BJX9_9STRA|mmetsp:Transcript_30169/g.69164  ORF Transcript_30169/g.69164 Transcript_30169/m.69164 type:complete len:125 (+) Transcript_30169:450-824(+)|eukprot:CAMPEP_0113308492 /NCGR_PEP_ID=MMETSP0010_2-20120614/6915_1 /TAXON_ID=216773 ORGANISM="Corethron hystrix, Strain 308" /NCGR_SAMPLE_ID=MMETSP0010_2 /ASSEMBLY_ACC=CAM_ASM_000155 /LENGTH=124 /DNA_ID=CAMNT_0000163557 /DNA_START=360 /DNA_END=734 /DNA_ORIENTATION=- /assembly_acc=CAM_ASM_000155
MKRPKAIELGMKWFQKLTSRKRRKPAGDIKQEKPTKKEDCDVTAEDDGKDDGIPSEITVPSFVDEGGVSFKDNVSVLDPSIMAGVDDPETLYGKKKNPLLESCHQPNISCMQSSLLTIFCYTQD